MSINEENIEETIFLKVTKEEGRIDKYLASELDDMSRSKIQLLIEEENILVNDEPTKANYKVQPNDKIGIFIPEAELIDVQPENIPLDILYEDSDLAIINKPQGMVVHPGAGHNDGTLVHALLYHIDDLSGINGKIRPGIVHRLDKDTSGILVIAKNDEAHVHLSKQLQDRSMKRKYWTLVHGVLSHNHGTIDAPIGRDPKNRQEFTVITGGKEAVSHFRVLERFKDYSLLEVSLETGRTHQIRVHLKYINHPVAGDETYGPKKTLAGKGQFLHAHTLEFIHPQTNQPMKFEAPVPEVFEDTLEQLRRESNY
ncbi:MAG TPA: RluA family pseudouridine synthase [Atopostipes sp.]|nr:RluA family pseudouridine synthase [Atopostipes sp.]